MKTYKVSDLFYTHWSQLAPQRIAEGYTAFSTLQTLKTESPEYGFALIRTLRALRKNWRLVDQLSVEQAVDIYNELEPSLQKPWLDFPLQRLAYRIDFLFAPKEKMGNRTFDHLMYADSYFTRALQGTDAKTNMAHLAAVLYTRAGEHQFDAKHVEVKSFTVEKHCHEWQLMLIFYTFAHIKKYIVDNCVHLFPQEGNSGTVAQVKDTLPLWTEVKFSLAESGVFGTFDDVGRTDLYKVINYLESRAKKQKEGAANAKSK
jgi:hypothetical protein